MELAGLADLGGLAKPLTLSTRSPSPSPVSTLAHSRASSMSSASFMPAHLQGPVSLPGMLPIRASSEPPQRFRGTFDTFCYSPQPASTAAEFYSRQPPTIWTSPPLVFQRRTPSTHSPSPHMRPIEQWSHSSHSPLFSALEPPLLPPLPHLGLVMPMPATMPAMQSSAPAFLSRRADSPSISSVRVSLASNTAPAPAPSSPYRVVQLPTRLEPVALPQALPMRRSRSRPVSTTLLRRILVPRSLHSLASLTLLCRLSRSAS